MEVKNIFSVSPFTALTGGFSSLKMTLLLKYFDNEIIVRKNLMISEPTNRIHKMIFCGPVVGEYIYMPVVVKVAVVFT